MRLSVDTNDPVLKEAVRLTGITDYRALIEFALREFIKSDSLNKRPGERNTK